MRTQSSPYGMPPHPFRRSSRQFGPVATVLLAFAITVALIAASGVLALLLQIGR